MEYHPQTSERIAVAATDQRRRADWSGLVVDALVVVVAATVVVAAAVVAAVVVVLHPGVGRTGAEVIAIVEAGEAEALINWVAVVLAAVEHKWFGY